MKSLVVAGDNFGRGAARDWATKGPYLLGVRAVLATSFNPTFRANLVKIGILPLKIDKSFYTEIKGKEAFDIELVSYCSFRNFNLITLYLKIVN